MYCRPMRRRRRCHIQRGDVLELERGLLAERALRRVGDSDLEEEGSDELQYVSYNIITSKTVVHGS